MTTVEPDPDIPDPADRTIQSLELVAAFDEVWPQWRSVPGECQREGVPMGWMAPETAPAGAVLAELSEDEQPVEAVPLTWQARKRRYLVLRMPEAPELWVRAVPAFPVTYGPEAVLLTREIEPERGIRRWLEHDIEGGWQVYGHDTPEGTVSRPEPRR